jgi:uncharacterized membrane protein (UPF0182 family)
MPSWLTTRARFWLMVAATAVVVLLTFSLLGWTVEWLWLSDLGYPQVFWRVNLTKLGLFVGGFLVFFLFFWLNVRALIATMLHEDAGSLNWIISSPVSAWSDSLPMKLVRIGLPTLGAMVFATGLASKWDMVIRFLYGGDFGSDVPTMDVDVGFFVFSLPLYMALQATVVALSLVAIGANVVVCQYLGLWRRWQNLAEDLRYHIFRSLSLNAMLFALTWGAGYYLDRFKLFFDAAGVVHGAGYTDVTVTIPALTIMVGASVALVGVFAAGLKLNRPQLAVLGLGSYVGIGVIALMVVPALFQHFVVKPNELELEEPYLTSNIDFTRKAFGIDKVVERPYPAATDLNYNDIAANQETLRNVRLWDWRPLLQSMRQLQEIRLYYRFYDIDVDRYRLDDGLRQVMVSARELADRLPDKADTWLNRHLQFTHGYGVAMSLAAHESDQGGPTLISRDLPPVTTSERLAVKEPGIYFGERSTDYRIVSTKIKELNYPQGDANVYSSYDGTGGILLNSYWRRVLFSWNQFDVNILLSSYITPQSRILIWRSIRERVAKVAPFLVLDRDPYIVASSGHLYWVQDAYTVSRTYPYSEQFRGQFNYIRNPIKAVVDAYNGSVDLYVVDDKDPVLGAYGRAFPGLFKPLSAMPEDMKAHLRYAPDMFEAQIEMYGSYHMAIPQVFYNNEDLWTLSREKYNGESVPMLPYYILTRLPEDQTLQFLLMTPLTPVNKDNMIAWMVGRSDFPDYGQLIVYKLPKDKLTYGPLQIEALIDQDTVISRQLALWDQRGSKVLRGNLIVVPIGKSLIYVEPVYLIAEVNDVPQLKRVIVAYGDKIAMEPTLEQSLRVVFGQAPATSEDSDGPAGGATGLSRIKEPFERAQAALQQGNWRGFGEAMDELNRAIHQPAGE